MKTKNDPHKDTPEQEIVPETTKEQAEQEHAWWESVKYPDPPYESDR